MTEITQRSEENLKRTDLMKQRFPTWQYFTLQDRTLGICHRWRIQVGGLITSFPHQISQLQLGLCSHERSSILVLTNSETPPKHCSFLLCMGNHYWKGEGILMDKWDIVKIPSCIKYFPFSFLTANALLSEGLCIQRHVSLYHKLLGKIQSALSFIFQGIQRRSENILECHCCKTGHKGAPSTHRNWFCYNVGVWHLSF